MTYRWVGKGWIAGVRKWAVLRRDCQNREVYLGWDGWSAYPFRGGGGWCVYVPCGPGDCGSAPEGYRSHGGDPSAPRVSAAVGCGVDSTARPRRLSPSTGSGPAATEGAPLTMTRVERKR